MLAHCIAERTGMGKSAYSVVGSCTEGNSERHACGNVEEIIHLLLFFFSLLSFLLTFFFFLKHYWGIVVLPCSVSFYIQQSESVVHIYPLLLDFLPIEVSRAWSRVPCAIQQVLISYLFYIVVQLPSHV